MKTILVLLLIVAFALLVYVRNASGVSFSVENTQSTTLGAISPVGAESTTWRDFGRKLSPERQRVRAQVLSMVEQAGIDPRIADEVVMAESSWNNMAIGDNGTSFGLWQINLYSPMGKAVHGITRECAFDPTCSTDYARKLIESKRSWNHWTTYKRIFGRYL